MRSAHHSALTGNRRVRYAPYTGQVTTRGGIPPNQKNTSSFQSNSRSRHEARDDISSLQVAIPNWYQQSAVETAPGAAATTHAAIEYPVGTMTQLLFSASATGTITNGSYLLSDALRITIPRGAVFFVRINWNNTAGILFSNDATQNMVDTANGEAYEFGATVTDKSMSGTILNTGADNSIGFFPVAIVGTTMRRTFAIFGDSIAVGQGDTFTLGNHDIGLFARAIGPQYAYINLSSGGAAVSNTINGGMAARLTLAAYCTDIIYQLGINDLGSQARTSAQVNADTATFIASFPTKNVIISTLTPFTTSTDSWATTGNQTLQVNANKIAVNAARRIQPTPVVRCLDTADLLETGRDTGLFKVDGTAFKWTPDGLHLSAFAYAAVAANLPAL